MLKKHVQPYPIAFAIMVLLTGSSLFSEEVNQADKAGREFLTIGSRAPMLDIEHWVSDGGGEFEHVDNLRDGKVYVVEFWATWCGPCVAAMPHLSELQAKYKEKGFQVVSISDEDLTTVEKFLKRDIRGDEDERTYGEVSSTYCLATDPDRSVAKDYMEAAGLNGIPTAFIIGRKGLIEWIGHPSQMDKPLEEVIGDQWDRDTFAMGFKGQQICSAALKIVGEKMRQEDPEGAVAAIDEVMGDIKSDEQLARLQSIRLQILVPTGSARAAKPLLDFAWANKDDGLAINDLCWKVYKANQDAAVPKELLKAATTASEWAAAAEPESGAVFDTLAHLYWLQGELDLAIAAQEKAVTKGDVSGNNEIVGFLVELLKEKHGKGSEGRSSATRPKTQRRDARMAMYEAADEARAIIASYERKMQSFNKWRSKASAEEIRLAMDSRLPKCGPVAKQLKAIAEKHPNSDAEFEALRWIASENAGDVSYEAFDVLIDKYLDREGLATALPHLSYRIDARSENCLRVALKSPNKQVHSAAALALADYLKHIHWVHDSLKVSPGAHSQFGAPREYMNQFQPNLAEVERLFEEALKMIKDDSRRARAEASLKEVRRLQK